jgi:glycosyltransferase involved in cell wall biosynthesis
VTVVVLEDPEPFDPTGVASQDRADRVRGLGADVVRVVSGASSFFRSRPRGLGDRLWRAWRPPDEELFHTLVDADSVRRAVEPLEPDVAFVYHHEMLAAGRTLSVPRLAAVGDPPHLSALYRFRELLPRPAAFRRIVALQAQARHSPHVLVELLRECESRGAFAAHHAAWLRAKGVEGCEYLRTPVPDPLVDRSPTEAHRADRPRILLVGHMKGVVTLNGLRLFAREILPRLERSLGRTGFEARLLGGYDPPADLAPLLDRPSVRLLGHVERPAEEFRSADVLLAPNSISLGVRVRIVTAFSYGTCVVSHRANAQGIPELVHEQNALLGASGEELADAVVDAVREAELRRRLGDEGRRTYERLFAPQVAVGRIREELRRIARPRVAAA